MAKRDSRDDLDDQAGEQLDVADWMPANHCDRRKVPWLWPMRIVGNAVCILDGAKNVGKSSLLAAIAAAVSAGRKLPGRRKQPPAGVVWLSGEDDYATIVRPRLEAAGADLSRIHFPPLDNLGLPLHLQLPAHFGLLQSVIAKYAAALLVLDPLSCYIDPQTTDLNSEAGARSVLGGLARLASALTCAVVGSRHLRKDRSGPRLDQGLGSVAISAVARSVLALDQPDLRSERRVLRVLSCTVGARPPALEYWHDYASGQPVLTKWADLPSTADDPDGDQVDPGERDVRQDCRQLLRRLIGPEWVSAKAVLAEADGAGLGLRTLRAAKAEMGVRSRRIGTATPAYWEWGPPSGGWPE